jgi:hypothetical protein
MLVRSKVNAPQFGVRTDHVNTDDQPDATKDSVQDQTGGANRQAVPQRPRFSYPSDLCQPAGPQASKAPVKMPPEPEKPQVPVTVRRKRTMDPH